MWILHRHIAPRTLGWFQDVSAECLFLFCLEIIGGVCKLNPETESRLTQGRLEKAAEIWVVYLK